MRPNHRNHPSDPKVADSAVGRFVKVDSEELRAGKADNPRQIRAPPPPRLGYSIDEFCASVGISVSYYYELKQVGRAPRTMRGLGVRQIISIEEAERWCRERTESAGSPPEAA
jgi:hypothetical protein